jgi:signal transduction histidine kinase
VSNLLSNALKYGQGRPVLVELHESGGAIQLTVTDHGIGIDSDSLQRIFGRFERAVSFRHYGASGWACSSPVRIAQAHGGNITASSQPDAGSTFTVTLPRNTGPAAAAGPPLASNGLGQ